MLMMVLGGMVGVEGCWNQGGRRLVFVKQTCGDNNDRQPIWSLE